MHSQNCEKWLLALYVCPSIHMEQLGSRWTDFHEIWYWRLFRKSVEKIQVSLMLDKNNRYFTWRHCTFSIISCSVLLGMKNISDKSCRETRNTHFMFNNFLWKIMWKNIVAQSAHRLCNTHCFSTATVVARTHLSVIS